MITCHFDTATDEQLLVIVNYDRNCPKDLLEHVIFEMMKRSLFRPFILSAIKGMRFYDLEDEDIEQMGHIAIWQAWKKYEVGRATFSTFCKYEIMTMFGNHIQKRRAEKRKIDRYSCSLDVPVTKTAHFHDIIPDETNVEKAVIQKISLQEQLSLLTELQKKTVLYFVEGYQFNEMAELLGKSRQSVENAFHRAVRNMGGEKMNLKLKREVVA